MSIVEILKLKYNAEYILILISSVLNSKLLIMRIMSLIFVMIPSYSCIQSNSINVFISMTVTVMMNGNSTTSPKK